ncbi:MAG: hypothetical protein K2J25_00640 [Oscillospiraceae bacterium]|nr:hypothetical protein [Oscillospiraceae bacterium]
MSTREIASYIFERLDEEQLKGFIALFGKFYPVENQLDQTKTESYEKLKNMIRSVPDLDYERELATYREEKYGV